MNSPLGVGVLAVGELQLPARARRGSARALDVAGRAVADVDDVPADRAVAELRVERRDAGDRRGRDVGQLADALERLARQVAVVRLDRLQDRDDRLGPRPELLDRLVDEAQIERVSVCWTFDVACVTFRCKTGVPRRGCRSGRPGTRGW